jgi:hypothetical protein
MVSDRLVDMSVIDVTTILDIPMSTRFDKSLLRGLVIAFALNSEGLKNCDAVVLLETGRTRTKNLMYASFCSNGRGDDVNEGVDENDVEGDAPIVKLGVIDEDREIVEDGVIVIVGVTVAVTDTVVEGEAPIESDGVGLGDAVIEGVGLEVGVTEDVGVPEGETVGVGVGDAVADAVVEGVRETEFEDDSEREAVGDIEGMAVAVAARAAAATTKAFAS